MTNAKCCHMIHFESKRCAHTTRLNMCDAASRLIETPISNLVACGGGGTIYPKNQKVIPNPKLIEEHSHSLSSTKNRA